MMVVMIMTTAIMVMVVMMFMTFMVMVVMMLMTFFTMVMMMSTFRTNPVAYTQLSGKYTEVSCKTKDAKRSSR